MDRPNDPVSLAKDVLQFVDPDTLLLACVEQAEVLRRAVEPELADPPPLVVVQQEIAVAEPVVTREEGTCWLAMAFTMWKAPCLLSC